MSKVKAQGGVEMGVMDRKGHFQPIKKHQQAKMVELANKTYQ